MLTRCQSRRAAEVNLVQAFHCVSLPPLSCVAIMNPTFGERAHMSCTPAPESGVGVTEMSLDDIIAKLKVVEKEDLRAEEILAAAITLRDSRGRDRQDALRNMASTWGVVGTERVENKY